MKKASSGSNFGNDADFGNVVPYFSFKLCICQDPKIARAYTAQNTKKKSARVACLAQRLSAFTSRCGTDTVGRGALEPPPEDVAVGLCLRKSLMYDVFDCIESTEMLK